jgi:hypothetical protein
MDPGGGGRAMQMLRCAALPEANIGGTPSVEQRCRGVEGSAKWLQVGINVAMSADAGLGAITGMTVVADGDSKVVGSVTQLGEGTRVEAAAMLPCSRPCT